MTTTGKPSLQKQNQQAQDRMRAIALRFKRDSTGFKWLIDILQLISESPERGILISFKQTSDQDNNICEGVWLSANRRFLEFNVLLPRDGEPPEIEFWNDVTDDIIVNAHQPGTGKSFGFLALELLDEGLGS
jgi:hypothetical protein